MDHLKYKKKILYNNLQFKYTRRSELFNNTLYKELIGQIMQQIVLWYKLAVGHKTAQRTGCFSPAAYREYSIDECGSDHQVHSQCKLQQHSQAAVDPTSFPHQWGSGTKVIPLLRLAPKSNGKDRAKTFLLWRGKKKENYYLTPT